MADFKRNIIELAKAKAKEDPSFIVSGATGQNELASWIWDKIDNGIDLVYEEVIEEFKAEGLSQEEIDEKLEDGLDFDRASVLFGDWKKNEEGQYEPNQEGINGFSAHYTDFCGGTIMVEWSKHVCECQHTSPCVRMSDGKPCGDLDSEGSSVVAYCLPAEYFDKEN